MITVTIEKTIRIDKEYDPTNAQMEAILKNGENPFHEDLEKELQKAEKEYMEKGDCDWADIEYNYFIADDDNNILVDWG